MDHTSIIVQVSKPDADPPNGNGNSLTAENGSLPGGDRVKPPHEQNTEAVKNRKSRRSFLSSLLCCFTPKSSSRHSTTSAEVTADTTDRFVPPQQEWSSEPAFAAVPSSENFLLPPATDSRQTIVIDLDETLVHSSFKPVENADFVVPVEIDGVVHEVYVLKRPHVDEFLQRMGKKFDCVLFTASLAKYADPVADLLDPYGVFSARLFRESCVYHRGNYVKDLSRLGRPLERVLIIDNSPASYIFHPDNAVAVTSWFDDVDDRELLDIVPFLEKVADCESVYEILRNANET